jgi:uncharacterized protein (DUF362 family)
MDKPLPAASPSLPDNVAHAVSKTCLDGAVTASDKQTLPDDQTPPEHQTSRLTRRAFLAGAGGAIAGTAGLGWWLKSGLRDKTPVFLAARQRYDGPLEQTIRDGLLVTGLDPSWLRGRKVLLKPNMVEPRRDAPHMTTHPNMVRAATEVFRRWGAQVVVGEAPGHLRDTDLALYESRIGEALDADRIEFADLNFQDVAWRKNVSRVSALPGLYFPQSVLEADLIVSMPKLKTHHWVGCTISLKNLYGTLPGNIYGWPKNVLHHAGIPQTVVDINAALPRTVAIVDGIECMEGDGPIMGSPKQLGLVGVGTNLTALDATCARIMGLDPKRVAYLALAAGRLGPVDDEHIRQAGEQWQPLVTPFSILDKPHLQQLRAGDAGELTS